MGGFSVGTYYWRIRAHEASSSQWGVWSGIWSFTLYWEYTFSGISPLDGGSTFDTTPLLNWDDVTGAAGYDVQIADSEAGLGMANIIEVTVSEYQIVSAYSYGETKYWRVRAVNEDEIAGAWGGAWQFEIIEFSSINTILASKGLSMQMVLIIPEGSTDTYRDMTLTSYALSETEVTQGDYETIRGSNPASGYGVGNDYPVYNVGWFSSALFCNAISTLLGLEEVYNESTWEADFTKNGFYLPIEAQWEFAAGGPNHYFYPLGDTFNASDYVYNDTQTQPVKSKPANGFGLYNVGGNVLEWCHDWYGSIYPHTGETDPTGPLSGYRRIKRGGYYSLSFTSFMISSYRRHEVPYYSDSISGFRVAVGGFGSW